MLDVSGNALTTLGACYELHQVCVWGGMAQVRLRGASSEEWIGAPPPPSPYIHARILLPCKNELKITASNAPVPPVPPHSSPPYTIL